MKLFNAPALGALALLSAAAVFPFLPSLGVAPDEFALEVTLTSTTAGHVQVYWYKDGGLSEANSSVLPVPARGAAAVYRLTVPTGAYDWLRFDPIDGDGTVVMESARMVDGRGRTVRSITPSDFGAQHDIGALRVANGRLEVDVLPGATDPQLLLKFDPRLQLRYGFLTILGDLAPRALALFLPLAVVLLALDRAVRLQERVRVAGGWLRSRPIRAVALASALAVVLSAYPVVFGGRSFVAPNIDQVRLLYEATPSLPGYRIDAHTEIKGSDVGAIFWQHIPFSMIEHRALLRDHEWPLWNRYDSGGSPLLGQGQSMLGDPMHLLVIAADGAAWAWDATYLAEKWILALGLGLLVLAVTRRMQAAVLVSVAAPFFGIFVYRINHPAFFSLCTAPWPLLCWVRASQARSLRSLAGWAAALILANLSLMNSGTVKEAYMLLIAMNFSGLCVVLAGEEPLRTRLWKLGVLAWALVLLMMINAPVWMTFLSTLHQAYTSYDAASAFQIQPSLLIGAFDEAFYRPLTPGGVVFNPSANFLVLAGVLYFLATLRTQFANRAALVIAASSLVPLALAFGLIPPTWIVQVPLLRNVAHVDNCFSCALIILWSVVAGAGFSAALDRLGTREGRADLGIAGLLLFALVFQYVAFGQAIHRPSFPLEPVFTVLKPGETLPLGRFVGTYLAFLLAALAALGLLARRWLKSGRMTCGTALGLVFCAWILLWRQALQPRTAAFGNYSFHPGPRADFHADSPAMDRMKAAQAAEPSRGVGILGSFFPGWTAAYGLEGISGPDALMNPFYRELTAVSPVERIWDWRLILTRDTLPAARPFLDFLNVKYYFGMPGDPRLGSGLVAAGHEDLDTYVSPTAWPRAFFTNRLAVYGTPEELVERVGKGDGRPFAAIQSKDIGDDALLVIPRDLTGRVVRPAEAYALTERTTQFTLHAPGPGVAVLNEVYWPGYAHAEVNGAEAKVIRLNHAFQGLVIGEAGDYVVTFSYEPRLFRLSLGIAAAGLVILALSLAAAFRQGYRPLEGSVRPT